MPSRDYLEIVIRAHDQATGPLNRVGLAVQWYQQQMRGVMFITDMRARMGRRLLMVSGAMAAGLRYAAYEAMGFQGEMRNVNSLAQLSEKSFRALGVEVMDLFSDRRIVDNPRELAQALYQIQGAGMEGHLGLKVLEISAQGATAGLSDTFTAADALTSILNAYNLRTGPQAQRVMDVLFETMRQGKVTFTELAGVIGLVAAAAAAAVPIEEVGAALATMTAKGYDAAISATALNRLITTMADPPEELREEIERLTDGMSPAEVIRTRGLAAAVELLGQATGGSADELAAMGFEMRELRAMFALTGEGAQSFRDDLQSMQQAKSAAMRWDHVRARLSGVAVDLGEDLQPTLIAVADLTDDLLDRWDELPEGAKKAALYIGIGATAITGLAGAETMARVGLTRLRAELALAALAEREWAAANVQAAGAVSAHTMAMNAQAGAAGRAGSAVGLAGAGRIAGAGAAGLSPLMPSATIAALSNPHAWGAAAGVIMLKHFHTEMVKKPLSELTGKKAAEVEAALKLAGKGYVFERFGARVDVETAAGHQPTELMERGVQKTLTGKGALFREFGFRPEGGAAFYRRTPEEQRTESLRHIEKTYGPEAYHWMLLQMPGTRPRELTPREHAEEMVAERASAAKEAEKIRQAQETAIREYPEFLPEMPQPPQGRGYRNVTQINVYANDREEMKRVTNEQIDRALPSH